MLSTKEVQKIAQLSRLALTDAEVAKFQTQLSDILDFVAQLQEVDTAGVEPLHQVGEHTSVVRSDEVNQNTDRELLLDSAPKRHGDYVETLAVFEEN